VQEFSENGRALLKSNEWLESVVIMNGFKDISSPKEKEGC